jgi:hypothetical protein
MEKIGKRSWNKHKQDNPIVKDLPKGNEKFKDADVCKDVDILLYDDFGNPSFISIASDSSEKDNLDKIFKIHYNDKLQQQGIVQVSKETFDKFIQTHKKS